MANLNFTPATPHQTGNVAYFRQAHLQEAQRIAATTAALNSLSMSSWNITSDTGSVRQAIVKAEQALGYLRKLEGGV